MSTTKLVRDLVPARLASEGLEYPVRVVADAEFKRFLHAKLLEEVNELLNAMLMAPASIAEEMADITEVMVALAAIYGVSRETVAAARAEKFARSGGFDNRYVVTFPSPRQPRCEGDDDQ